MAAQLDSEYRRFGLKKTIRRLASYALFEGRPHTTRGQWFNPFVFLLLRSIGSLPGQPSVPPPIFITGVGRSGTTVLGTMMSLHSEVGYLNEPKAIWYLIDPRHDINGDYRVGGGRFRLGKSDVYADSRRKANRIFKRYLSLVGARRLVDKYPELIFRVEYLLSLFPASRFIFLSRDGVNTITSIETWSERHSKRTRNGGVEDWWGRNDIKWRYLCEQLILADPEMKTVHQLATPDLDHINRAALEWIITMREGLKQKARFPNSIIHVRYENLVKEPVAAMTRLLDAVGLPSDQAVIEYAKEKLHEIPQREKPKLKHEIDELFTETTHAMAAMNGCDS